MIPKFRRIMLWITAMAVKQVASLDPVTAGIIGSQIDMITVVAVALVCILATLWPIIYVVIKVLSARFTRNIMYVSERINY